MRILPSVREILEVLPVSVEMITGDPRDAAVNDHPGQSFELGPIVVLVALHLMGGTRAAEQKTMRKPQIPLRTIVCGVHQARV